MENASAPTRPLRIVLATPLYPPDIGGPATDSYAVEVSLRDAGHEPIIVAFGQVRRYPKLIRHLAYFLHVWRAAARADIVFSFDMVSVGLPAYVAARLRGARYAVRIPGDYAWEQGVARFGVKETQDAFQHRRYGWRVEFLRALQRFVLRRADLVLVISEYFMRVIDGWGIPPDRVRRIYLGIPDEPPGTPPAIGGRVMFSAGRFVPWKGFPMLVDLVGELPGWTLVIAGNGPLRPAIAAQAVERGVADRVLLPGSVSRDALNGWLARADALVLNTHQENFCFQALEAMRAGAAIVTTRIGSLPELIEDGKEGVLLAPDDRPAFAAAVRSIERDPETWAARRAAARERAKRFSLEASARETIAALESLCG